MLLYFIISQRFSFYTSTTFLWHAVSHSYNAVVVNLFCIGTPFRICSKTCTPLPCTKIYYCKYAKFKRLLSWRRCLADFKWKTSQCLKYVLVSAIFNLLYTKLIFLDQHSSLSFSFLIYLWWEQKIPPRKGSLMACEQKRKSLFDWDFNNQGCWEVILKN